MSITYGLTADGFVPKPLQVVRDDLNLAFQARFGSSIDLGDRSIFGQIIGIIAERIALLWELAEVVNSSQDPDKATGVSLDALCALTGTTRPVASYSTVRLTCMGAVGTVIAAGSRVQTTSTEQQFATMISATIASVPAWAGSTAYVVGDRVSRTVSGVVTLYECIVAGTSGFGPLSGTGSDLTDGGTVHWKSIGTNLPVGTGAVDVDAQSVVVGQIEAAIGDITTIVNTVFGWNAVTNLAAASKGREIATDEELRQLRVAELSGSGNSPADAIRAALLQLADVIAVTVFYNDTDATNTDGMPPHSVEALVRPNWSPGNPLDQAIFDTLFRNVAAGIATTGNQTGTSIDTQGVSHTVKFSRPTETPIYIIFNVTYDPATFPSDGAQQIKDAITTWGATIATGRDVVATALIAKVFQVAGVLDVPVCHIGIAPSPSTSTTIVMDARHLATYADGNITVNLTPGTP